MIALLFLALAAFLLFRFLGGAPRLRVRRHQPVQVAAAKIDELTEYAHRLRVGNKYTSAEKVYLQILKIDHKHVSTYSRLGTLYSAQKKYGDAIECFQVATQLSPSGSTFYNLGVAYYENKNPMKAIAALEKSIMFEPSLQRYVALAKTFGKLGDSERMIGTLEQAVQFEPNSKVYWLLADAYAAGGQPEQQERVIEQLREHDPKDARLKAEYPKRKPKAKKTPELEKTGS